MPGSQLGESFVTVCWGGSVLLLALLVVGIVVLTPLADRINVPQPILLLLYGLVLAVLPGMPALDLNAELVLPVVLPPLLFAATQRTTVGQFRDAAGPVLLLAVGLTVSTAAVAAVVAHLAGLPWTAALVLGAIVSPPDPVAATAVARRLRLPERMVTVLEGEGMFNDATALVMYKVAVAVAVTGEFSASHAGIELLLTLVVGLGAGLLLGWLTKVALAALHDAAAETTVTIAAPFVAYLGAEHFEGSGVLAVLVLGLYLRSYAHPALTARGWLLGRSVWDYADFLITGGVFVLVGFELTVVIGHTTVDSSTVWLAVAVLATVVFFRPLWLFPATALTRTVARRRDAPVPYGWRETAVVSWAGMRGIVTVATALALPHVAEDGSALDWRAPVVLVGLACVLVTLVAQGLTLTPLVRRLRVGSDSDEHAEANELRREAMHAAARTLRDEAGDPVGPAHEAVIAQYEARLHAQNAVSRAMAGALDASGPAGAAAEAAEATTAAEAAEAAERDFENQLSAVLDRASAIEREVALKARTSGTVTPAAADEVLHDIEVRAARTFR
ncbi:MAG: sodium:proton antiporter [Kineosporiaceae bacterium]